VATVAIFDLDKPKVGIEAGFTCKDSIRLAFRNTVGGKHSNPAPIALRAGQASRRGAKEKARPVKAIDFDKDRTRVVVAMAYDNGGRTFDRASAEVALDPKLGSETHDARNLVTAITSASALPLTPGRYPPFCSDTRQPRDEWPGNTP